MGLNSPPKSAESNEKPKNKFLEIYTLQKRVSERAESSKQKLSPQTEGYAFAAGNVHFSLEKAYLKSVGKEPIPAGDTDKTALDSYINSLSVEEIDRHIDMAKDRQDMYLMAKEEDGKYDLPAETKALINKDMRGAVYALDGLEEVRSKLTS